VTSLSIRFYQEPTTHPSNIIAESYR
jgi:hypothetical protein